MVVYISVDSDNYLTGWSSTRSNDDDKEINVYRNHEALQNPEVFKYVDGELIKDEERQQELIAEREENESKPSEAKRNELAIMELAGMLASLSPQTRMAIQSIDDSGGDKMIALLYATNIIEGWITFDEVGHIWVEDVKRILKSEGREDLIK